MASAPATFDHRKEGKRLSKLRKARGLKASWVADKMGISAVLLCCMEQGTRHWTPERVKSFMRAIGGK